MTSPDLFLDPMIHKLTEMCLLDVLSGFKFVKFDDNVPGIDSFFDFYTQVSSTSRFKTLGAKTMVWWTKHRATPKLLSNNARVK